MLADAHYGTGLSIKEKFMDSVLKYCLSGSADVKAAMIPVARLGFGQSAVTYDNLLFYNGNASTPAIFSDFQGGNLPASASTVLRPISLARFSQSVAPAFEPGGESYGLRQRFHVVSTIATKEAMEIVHDVYFDAMTKLTNITHFTTGLAYLAITTPFLDASNSGIGCPQGPESKPTFWIEQALTWGDAADDALVDSVLDAANAEITKQLVAIKATSKYLYLNDADADQKVFESYPAANLARLKNIRAKYDPKRIYTDLMPGGFKVAHAGK
jgi:hypothetical protein